jgi:hypothetical protein
VEVLFAQPVALAAPDVGAPADDARASLPAERLVIGVGVGLFEIVGEPLVVPLATGVAVPLLRSRTADEVARPVAVLEVVGRDVLGEVFVALRLPCFEQRDFDSSLGQPLGRPSTGSSRTHHDHIERRLHVESLRGSIVRKPQLSRTHHEGHDDHDGHDAFCSPGLLIPKRRLSRTHHEGHDDRDGHDAF